MQQIYRRTLVPKCSFNKVAKQLYWKQLYSNHTSAWVFSCKFAAYLLSVFLFCEKGVLKNVEKFKGRHLCQSLLLIKLQAAFKKFEGILSASDHIPSNFLKVACNFIKKRGSGTGVLLWIFRHFYNTIFLYNTGCFCQFLILLRWYFSMTLLRFRPRFFSLCSELIKKIASERFWRFRTSSNMQDRTFNKNG